jgi:co-chaperonin GroES (HSP10)
MFRPVNRYILINLEQSQEKDSQASLIVLPEDYKPEEEQYATANVVTAAADVRFDLSSASKIVIDKSMIEQIKIGHTNYSIILDNYVVGIVE